MGGEVGSGVNNSQTFGSACLSLSLLRTALARLESALASPICTSILATSPTLVGGALRSRIDIEDEDGRTRWRLVGPVVCRVCSLSLAGVLTENASRFSRSGSASASSGSALEFNINWYLPAKHTSLLPTLHCKLLNAKKLNQTNPKHFTLIQTVLPTKIYHSQNVPKCLLKTRLK